MMSLIRALPQLMISAVTAPVSSVTAIIVRITRTAPLALTAAKAIALMLIAPLLILMAMETALILMIMMM